MLDQSAMSQHHSMMKTCLVEQARRNVRISARFNRRTLPSALHARAFSASSVDAAEIRKFTALAARWWERDHGPFAGLHRMNHVRVPFVVRNVRRALGDRLLTGASASAAECNVYNAGAKPLSGLSVLDVGCGGGILAEALARLGADTTGIDASDENVAAAAAHASSDARLQHLQYRACTAEALLMERAAYDCVVTSEVIEHVHDPAVFAGTCAALVKPGGVLIVTTINRTPAALFQAILGAEYVLRIVPRGTHEWAKFVTPEELQTFCARAGLQVADIEGLGYSPLRSEWYSKGADTSVNYALAAVKPLQ